MLGPIERSSPWQTIVAMVVTILLSLIFQAAPSRVLSMFDYLPFLPLITLFIWSIRHPRYVAPWLIFMVGLFQDFLTGGILGIWALSYLIAFSIARIREEDSSGEILLRLWARFAALTAIAVIVALLVGSLALGQGRLVGFQDLMIQATLTLLLFPLLAGVFARRKERSTFS